MMSQTIKVSSKTKKNTRDREKRKSFTGNIDGNCNSFNDKSSPTTDTFGRKYAGLSIDNIRAVAEQIMPEILSEESCQVLAEDLNYKLRYIINQAYNRAILSKRSAISSNDVEETFIDLGLDKVYGADSTPLWIPFGDQNYLYLDDPKVDIIEEIEQELAFSQPAEPVLVKSWLSQNDESIIALKNYFRIICESIITSDIEVRKMALQNISSNPNIGPIVEWFYKFGFLLLSKDITYDLMTLSALDLIETLEMSPVGNNEVGENQLKLLVRLILQRLLKSFTNPNILKPMCWVLAILCRRYPLREFVLTKLKEKLPQLSLDFSLPLIMIINALGIDGILIVFVQNLNFFINSLADNWHSLYAYAIMETYYLLYKNGITDLSLFSSMQYLESFKLFLNLPLKMKNTEKRELEFINMRKKLIKTWKKIEIPHMKKFIPYETLFEVPNYQTRMKQKLENHYKLSYHNNWKKQSYIITGKISVILPVLRNKKPILSKCCDHSLYSYNL